ncbi:hypothetical protein I6N95_01170 [Vagococcus sp. BWB3-3]|uniref:WxL domain-containing protein n=1 Tax=Vagococcus allomyrinae TaxID=2794353 RepID=A0A940P189_9ENTE|nr:hypothetical protein [Vagococcus allomyrinae]MBP1039607.1 hypothetical protein [Vagococcus allomyrinae]
MKKEKFLNLLVVGLISLTSVSTATTAVAETKTFESAISSTALEKTLILPTDYMSKLTTSLNNSPVTVSSDSEESTNETVKITFKATADHTFTNGESTIETQGYLGDQLLTIDFPSLVVDEAIETLVGWKLDGQLLNEQEIKQEVLTGDCVLTAVTTKKTALAKSRALNVSIADVIQNADTTKLIVIPSPTGSDPYKEYTSTDANMKTALSEMYHNGDGRDFTIYFGANLTLTASTVAKVVPSEVNATNATFYALQGKVGTLTLTGAATDPINMNTTTPANVRTVNLTTSGIYFGTDLIIRNLVYQGNTIYMGGKNLSLNGGASGNGFTIYGGTDSGDLTESPTVEVNTTGTGIWNFYGGNQTSGTITGNTTIRINNTTGAVNTIAGGARIGTINGNTTTEVKNVSGAITNFYGGGEGTTTANLANVTGNVTSTIFSENASTTMRIGSYFGGVNYGNISGSVSNTVKGNGGWTAAWRDYYGGSAFGDIGSSAEGIAIVNHLDTSQFTTGTIYYNGANSREGTINGGIRNTIRAGAYNRGSIGQINGASGRNVTRLTHALNGSNNLDTYDAMTDQQRNDLAEAGAKFKVYGDIYTDILGGAVSAGGDDIGFTKGFGWGGYLQGNTYVTMGTLREDGRTGGEGFAYDGDSIAAATLTKAMNEGLDYAAANRSSFAINNAAQFDIVGGGGSIGAWTSDVFIQGHTNVVLNNTIARWTYGAGFSGVTQGSTNITLNGGFVDTLEGAGYYDRRVYGETKAIVNNGQVDWFLSGGGWNSLKVVGDANVDVHDGVVNASMGASYGDSAAHTIDGNSHMYVYGGDFSGLPRTGNSGFSAGITQQGTLTGDSNLTIDLRNYKGAFKFPSGTFISAGKPYSVNTFLGTNTSNTMNLNIFADESAGDVLNGADIYGDGGAAANTKSGQVNINIDAPGSTIGNLYATQYNNVAASKLLRDVKLNVQRVKSIGGISGGSASDVINNTVARNSAAATPATASTFNFGVNVSGEAGQSEYPNQEEPIMVAGIGINNFTKMTIQNETTLMANGGNIRNGLSATAANHGTTYNEFGDIHLMENSGLGVATGSNFISAGKLTVEGESSIESGQGTGIINISDIEFVDQDNDRLTWIKNTTTETSKVTAKGTWFGSRDAFQVLTVNPTVQNANKLTPLNFMGREKATGKTFIGDNDVTGAANGYGIMIPGSVIDYQVIDPIQDGAGDIMHDVASVLEGNTPIPLKVWGTEIAGKKVQQGRLVIPSDEAVLPTLTFTPETAVTGSWLYNARVKSTSVGLADNVIPEQNNSDPVTWKSPAGTYSYSIKVQYSNKVELMAQNVLITESEAALIKNAADLATYTKAAGRPFLENDITESVLGAIRQPLAEGQLSRPTTVTYQAGTVTSNQAEKVVKVVVVKDQTVIGDSRQLGVYAQAGEMTLEQANGLRDQEQLETDFTKPLAIFADGTTGAAQSDLQTFLAVKQATEEELLKIVKIAYSYSLAEETVVKEVEVKITGILEINEVPTTFNFGDQIIANREKTYWPTIVGDLVIKDTRGTEKQAWQLMLKEETPLTNGSQTLANRMSFVSDGEQQITADNIIIQTHTLTSNGTYNVTESWREGEKGIKLQVPVKQQKVGQFSGTLSWSLVDGPAND